MEAILAGLLGLLIGSFLNVCIHRMPRDLSVVAPRSQCPSCYRTIAWYDNIPVLSWVALQGRCRNCHAAISWRYPAVELTTGLLFGFVVFAMGATAEAAKHCVFAAVMVALIFTDFEERILPDEFTLGGTVAGVLFAAFVLLPPELAGFLLPPGAGDGLVSLVESASGGALPALMLWVIGFLYGKVRGRDVLGFGDVKMVACIGAFLGLGGALLTILVGSLLGSVVGIGYLLLSGRDWSTYELPFGSFLGVAAIAVALHAGPLRFWLGPLQPG